MRPPLRLRLVPDRGFERIYRRHAAAVYVYTLAMLGNSSDAEDVTRTIFRNAHGAYAQGERPRAVHNWLLTIAHEVCRQRSRQVEGRGQEPTANEGVAAVPVRGDGTTSTLDVQRALERLLFYQRSALVMREVGRRSYAQIAQTLQFSVDAVEPLLFAARHTLLEQLDGALSCRQAELALSRQLDDRLPSAEAAFLQAHLRECTECDTLARRQRGYRAAMNALGAIQLPPSLASWGSRHGVGTARTLPLVGGRLAAKAAAVVTAGVVIGGAYEAAKRLGNPPAAERAATGEGGLLAGEAPSVRATILGPGRAGRATRAGQAGTSTRGALGVAVRPQAFSEIASLVGERYAGLAAAVAASDEVRRASLPRARKADARPASRPRGKPGRGGSLPPGGDVDGDQKGGSETPVPPSPPPATPAASAPADDNRPGGDAPGDHGGGDSGGGGGGGGEGGDGGGGGGGGDNPPGNDPPGDNPPGDNPPGDDPPGDNPPSDDPPGDDPPSDDPPGDDPPGDDPPGDDPPPEEGDAGH